MSEKIIFTAAYWREIYGCEWTDWHNDQTLIGAVAAWSRDTHGMNPIVSTIIVHDFYRTFLLLGNFTHSFGDAMDLDDSVRTAYQGAFLQLKTEIGTFPPATLTSLFKPSEHIPTCAKNRLTSLRQRLPTLAISTSLNAPSSLNSENDLVYNNLISATSHSSFCASLVAGRKIGNVTEVQHDFLTPQSFSPSTIHPSSSLLQPDPHPKHFFHSDCILKAESPLAASMKLEPRECEQSLLLKEAAAIPRGNPLFLPELFRAIYSKFEECDTTQNKKIKYSDVIDTISNSIASFTSISKFQHSHTKPRSVSVIHRYTQTDTIIADTRSPNVQSIKRKRNESDEDYSLDGIQHRFHDVKLDCKYNESTAKDLVTQWQREKSVSPVFTIRYEVIEGAHTSNRAYLEISSAGRLCFNGVGDAKRRKEAERLAYLHVAFQAQVDGALHSKLRSTVRCRH